MLSSCLPYHVVNIVLPKQAVYDSLLQCETAVWDKLSPAPLDITIKIPIVTSYISFLLN